MPRNFTACSFNALPAVLPAGHLRSLFTYQRASDSFAIEVKASRTVAISDLGGLARFADYYGKSHRRVVWYLGTEPRRVGDVDVLPWQQGLRDIGW
jgi:hypothetical protein